MRTRPWLGRAALLAGGTVLSLGFAAATLLIPHARAASTSLGRDTGFVSGFRAPEPAGPDVVRWTNGEAVVVLAGVGPCPAVLRLRLASHPGRPDERVQVVVNDTQSAWLAPTNDFATYDLNVAPARRSHDLSVVIRSGWTRDAGGRPFGVRVGDVVAVTGPAAGLAAAFSRLAVPLVILFGSLLVAGFVVPVFDLEGTAISPVARRAAVAIAAAAAGFGLVAAFWFDLVAFLPVVGLGVAVGAASLVAARHLEGLATPLAHGRRNAPVAARWLAFVVLSAVILIVFFREAVFGGMVLSQGDILFRMYPWAAYRPAAFVRAGNVLLGDVPMLVYPYLVHAVDAIRHGTFPLWDAGTYAGHPFFAAFQSAVLSPFTALALLVPLPQATVLIAAARMFVGGLGMCVFIRALGLGWSAAAFAGVAYLLNPFTVVWLEHPLSAVAAWVPWLLWATERAAAGGRARDSAVLALSTALVLLAGHPETSLKAVLFAGGYGVIRAASGRGFVRNLACVAAGMVAGLSLSAIQVLPFLEYLRQSRALAARAAFLVNPFVAPPNTLITALVPDFFGSPVLETYAGPSNYCEQQVYAGVATWILAAVGVVAGWRDGRVRYFGIATLAAAAIMYGAPGVIDVVSRLPVLQVTALNRFGMVVITAAIIVAAFGVEALTRVGEDRRTPAAVLWVPAGIAAALATVAVLAALRLERTLLDRASLAHAARHDAAIAILLALAAFLIVSARARRRLAAAQFAVAAVGLVGGDLLLVGQGFHPLIPPASAFPRLAEVDAIRRDPEVARVTGVGDLFVPNTALVYGLQDFRGYDAIGIGPYAELLDAAFPRIADFHQPTRIEDPRLLDLLNVKYVFAGPDQLLPEGRYTRLDVGRAPVYRNNKAFPRTFLVDHYQVTTGNPALRILRDGRVDLRRVVLLSEEPAVEARPEAADTPEAIGTATISRYDDMEVGIATESGGRRLLVLTDAFYPGWTATIDGRRAPILRANFAFRAVAVGPGRHAVRFEYRPASFRIGAAISGVTLIILIGVAVGQGRSARSRSSGWPEGALAP